MEQEGRGLIDAHIVKLYLNALTRERQLQFCSLHIYLHYGWIFCHLSVLLSTCLPIPIFCFCQPWPSRILSTLSSHFLSPQKASNKAKSCCSTLPPCSHYPPPPVTQHLISLSSFPSTPTLSPLLLLAVIYYPLEFFFFPPKKSLLRIPRKENPYFDIIWGKPHSLFLLLLAFFIYLNVKKNQNSIKLPSHNSSHKSDEFSTRRVLLTSVSLFPSSRTCIFFWFVSFIRPHLHVSLNY